MERECMIWDGPADAIRGLVATRKAIEAGRPLSDVSERTIRSAIAEADRIRALLDQQRRAA